ncbi:DmsC/YnfH family molybdoenzyme membrane anchor subunit [Rariglobus hedericola]|uniref:Molybdopterin oxidoreductase n=1 Tax=Rariglobus hedericola TaxID=2597822 RepID=A0A556QQ93_9BACT|nr:DmsC/YnfH family molybdoenzyme membrane anchor subunit [Rariglobus hedericola]TSJ78817.1 molybdopterin oxidoreductase [Rariglobus hedericola]
MTDPVRTLIDELIESQRRLDTPVARFATAHDSGNAPRSQLIPLSAPVPGEQYAFQVDLDSCTGCKACVAGCHSLNGLDENETWRDVGLVLGGTEVHPFQQTVTTACHHCEDPACLNGCPVLAYEKDPVTGIVVHLDDQCIGCSYCVLKCPYDVPKFNDRLGIVRKCDMCHGRLAAGEAPACVQSCPTEAITIIKVTSATEPSQWLHAAPDPSYTKPTTRYVSKNPLPHNLRAADADTLRPQHAHYALVVLLVLTQLGLGLLIGSLLWTLDSGLPLLALTLFTAGLVASVAHLGQPFRAWRIFLGLRRSWLSREAVLLGTAFPLFLTSAISEWIVPYVPSLLRPLIAVLSPTAILIATAGVFCSAMIYTDTRRHFWRLSQTLGRMAGTVVIAALAFYNPKLAALALAAKLAIELITYRGDSVSARLQQGPLRRLWGARLILAFLTAGLFLSNHAAIGFFFLLIGELIERTLFFQAVDSPKMPGVPSS